MTTMALHSEQYAEAASSIERIAGAQPEERVFLDRSIDRFFEKLMYRLDRDTAWRSACEIEEAPSHIERESNTRAVIAQMSARFREVRSGRTCLPIVWVASSSDDVEKGEDARILFHACRQVERVARKIDWKGSQLVRLS
jgi:hypothetical protein